MSLGSHLDLSATSAVAVVITTAVMYLLLVLLLRTWGPRLVANPSSRTTATLVVLGAIVGRTSLGLEPDLEAGVLALGTVLIAMVLLPRPGIRAGDRVDALVIAGELCPEALQRHGLTEADLWSRLRQSGTGSLAGVALALLEPTGQISVIAAGSALDRRAVADVRGAESLPDSLFADA